jgi:hypothetical protein
MISVLQFILLVALQSASQAKAGSSCSNAIAEAGKNLQFRIPTTLSTATYDNWVSRKVSAWSDGGGPKHTIASDVGHPFGGRAIGGGNRKDIYGTRIFGSGYPAGYEASNPSNSSVAGRGFPYGTWPISWGTYHGGEEYSTPDVAVIRPGGQLATAQVSTTDTSKWPGASPDEMYTIIGDRDSVMFMLEDLVWWCHAVPRWPRAFEVVAASSNNNSIRPESVIQYYRASSFALVYTGYNNSFAINSTSQTIDYDQSTPLPSSIANSQFLNCINHTIGAAIPIIDSPPGKALSSGAIAGITIATVIGIFLLVVLYLILWDRLCTWLEDRKDRKLREGGYANAQEMEDQQETQKTRQLVMTG